MNVATNPRRKSVNAAFLRILPRIVMHANFCFRGERNAERREEAIAETVALAWQWYLGLVKRGKNVADFASTFANFVARAVRNGRRICGQQAAKDVMSPRAQRRHQFAVYRLPDFSMLSCSPISEALADNTVTPPDEQAAFRLDFASWLGTRTDRDQRLVEDLIIGELTSDVARSFGLTAGRVSQLRREYCQDWQRFCGEAVASPHARVMRW